MPPRPVRIATVLRVAILTSPLILLAGPALANLILLTTVARPDYYDDLERAAAATNQSVYETLLGVGCDRGQGNSACSAEQLTLFEETRKLVQTANDILGNGEPTEFSLGLGDVGLGNALRWTAAEEASATSRVATDFNSDQVASVNTRITALRLGATGFSFAQMGVDPDPQDALLTRDTQLGPAGAAETLSRLGGFMNVTYGRGKYDPTTYENAFDYWHLDLSFGADYRFSNSFSAGVFGGYARNEVEYDSTQSVVDGGIESQGFAVGGFAMYSPSSFYTSLLISYQRMHYDIHRFITYPSLNPDVDGANTSTLSRTYSNAYTAAAGAGYTYRFGPGKSKRFILDPYTRLEYTYIGISGYEEANVDPNEVYALEVATQPVQSLEIIVGLRASVALSTPVGVFHPYARFSWSFELLGDTRQTVSQYSAIGPAAGGDLPFLLASEAIDLSYGNLAAGVQATLLGGRQRTLGGRVGGRLSTYAEYRTVLQLDNVTTNVFAGGLRYMF